MGKIYLTIKEFSILTHTSIDTLKYYDRIGLLKPAFIGSNKYRYYRPEQSLTLTRIVFGTKAQVSLRDIQYGLASDDPHQVMDHYNQISSHLSSRIRELMAICDTIRNMKYYYGLAQKYPLNQLFMLYLPEWFLIHSPRLKIGSQYEATESNIANRLFMRGFQDGLWPHYQLGAFFTEQEFQKRDFTQTSYFLKTDHPEKFKKEELVFVPKGKWCCMLLNVKGQNLPVAMKQYIKMLRQNDCHIKGCVFIMDVVNSMLTTDADQYRTMIFSLKDEL